MYCNFDTIKLTKVSIVTNQYTTPNLLDNIFNESRLDSVAKFLITTTIIANSFTGNECQISRNL